MAAGFHIELPNHSGAGSVTSPAEVSIEFVGLRSMCHRPLFRPPARNQGQIPRAVPGPMAKVSESARNSTG